MNILILVEDDDFDKKKIYGVDHYYYEFNQEKFKNQIVVCVNVLEHFNNIELLKFSIWCKRHETRIVAYGNLNEFPLFGVFADAAILLPSSENSLYEGSTFYQCRSDVIDKMMSESLYFPARMSFLNERHWHINGVDFNAVVSGDFIGCHVINVCRSNYDPSIKPVHFLLEIAAREVSDEEVLERFAFPPLHVRRSSLEKYDLLKASGEIGDGWIVGEIKRGDGCGGDHLKSVLEPKVEHLDLTFVLDADRLSKICSACGSNYMEVQLLCSFLSNWMWICYGGSSSIFSFFPVKIVSLSDSMCDAELSRKLSVKRFGERLGELFPEFETLVYCMPGEEDGPSRTDGHRPLPDIRGMIKELSASELKFEWKGALRHRARGRRMTVKFLTGYSGYGGSTICLLDHCKLLDSAGIDAHLYGPQDWHLSRYGKSMMSCDFKALPDDVVVYHYLDADRRPSCRKFFLFLHETNLYDLRLKDVSFFDEVLFSSESQRAWHGANGGTIVPNVMDDLVCGSIHNPPNKNVAGVVGHVHPIKSTHVSILRALEDGMDRVHVYGPAYPPYFDEQIRPMLSERVVYKGFYEPERRMEIYNDFDVLYHFGEYESACLVLGECRILGKKVVKCGALMDYDFYSKEQILEIWKSLLG